MIFSESEQRFLRKIIISDMMIFKNCNADFLILVPTFRLLRQPFFSRQG